MDTPISTENKNNHIFELPHIFIIFHPGTSGNFIAGLLSKLIKSESIDLYISNNGSSHTTIDRKIAGTDYMSFGTIFEDQLCFPSQEKRVEYYLEKIKELNSEITTPQIIWSHDFTNIPLYKKFFSNSKILVITQNSEIEKLVAVCMNVIKNWMDPNHTPPFPPRQWQDMLRETDFVLKIGLEKLVGEEKSKDIILNKFDNANHNIIKFIRLRQMLGYFRLLHLVDKKIPATKDVANSVLFRNSWEEFIKNPNNIYKVGLPYESYITSDCVQLPYNYLIEGKDDLLINAIDLLVDNLTDEERIYIKSQFNKYRDMQDHTMLTDPHTYYTNLEKTVNKK